MGQKFRLRECREQRGYTQKQIADVLGCTRECYTQYESGRREISLGGLMILADFYKCTTDEILGTQYYYAVVKLQGGDSND